MSGRSLFRVLASQFVFMFGSGSRFAEPEHEPGTQNTEA